MTTPNYIQTLQAFLAQIENGPMYLRDALKAGLEEVYALELSHTSKPISSSDMIILHNHTASWFIFAQEMKQLLTEIESQNKKSRCVLAWRAWKAGYMKMLNKNNEISDMPQIEFDELSKEGKEQAEKEFGTWWNR